MTTRDRLIVDRLKAYRDRLDRELDDRHFYSGGSVSDISAGRTTMLEEVVRELDKILKLPPISTSNEVVKR